jgi:anti-anti-sigma factor
MNSITTHSADKGITLRPHHLQDEFKNRQLLHYVNKYLDTGCLVIRVDLAQVRYLHSTAINFLLQLYHNAREKGGRIFLTGVSPQNRSLLQLMHLEKYFEEEMA